jgi:2-amino-4-hydroxy-6-hydroxymethyldihydropteridine diphosphokinase
VVLGLGSNRGDSREILRGAIRALKKNILTNLREAPVYETAPWGITDQNWFFNTAVAGLFSGSPGELLEGVQRIEAAFGRDRSRERRWGERTLDIDILLFGDRVVSEAPVLEIPHPRLGERAFALVPLLDLLPMAADPHSGRAYRDLLGALGDAAGAISG